MPAIFTFQLELGVQLEHSYCELFKAENNAKYVKNLLHLPIQSFSLFGPKVIIDTWIRPRSLVISLSIHIFTHKIETWTCCNFAERSQDAHQYSSRKRSSLRRPKTADGSPEPIAIPNQAEDVSTSYSNDVYEQPSSDLLVPGFTSGEDTYEEHFFAENNAPSTSSIEEEACTNEQSSYEAIGPSFPCVEEVYEEEIFNKNFVPGSVSIEEVYSITSPIRTPESIPSSYIALNTQHDSVWPVLM